MKHAYDFPWFARYIIYAQLNASTYTICRHVHNTIRVLKNNKKNIYDTYVFICFVNVLPVSHDDMAWLLAIDLFLQVLVSSDKSSVASTRTKRSMMSAHAQQDRHEHLGKSCRSKSIQHA